MHVTFHLAEDVSPSTFGRINCGNASGDQALAERFLNLFYRI